MIREFDWESSSHQTASSAKRSSIFAFSAGKSKTVRTFAHFAFLRQASLRTQLPAAPFRTRESGESDPSQKVQCRVASSGSGLRQDVDPRFKRCRSLHREASSGAPSLSSRHVGPAGLFEGLDSKIAIHVHLRRTGKKAKTKRPKVKTVRKPKPVKLVCRNCGSADLAPSFIERRDRRCRKCLSQRYGSAARTKKTKVKK